MRLVHPRTAHQLDVSSSNGWLIETELEARDLRAWTHHHGQRRLVREERRYDPGHAAAFEAVRADVLIEQGWVPVKGDAGALEALSALEPWASWKAVAADPDRLAELWAPWAAPDWSRSVARHAIRITATLTALRMTFPGDLQPTVVFARLPLGGDALSEQPPDVAALLACHGQFSTPWNDSIGWFPDRKRCHTPWEVRQELDSAAFAGFPGPLSTTRW